MKTIFRFPHGTYERCVGTEDIPGCDCGPCTAAWRFRVDARKSFTYYVKPESFKRTAKSRRQKVMA